MKVVESYALYCKGLEDIVKRVFSTQTIRSIRIFAQFRVKNCDINVALR